MRFQRAPVSAGGNLATTGTSETLSPIKPPFYVGIVVEVVVNHSPSYEYGDDGYNVGAAKIRLFDINPTTEEELLPWADPIDTTIKQLPLIGELVVVYDIQGNKYYSRQVPIGKRLQQNSMLNLNRRLNKREEDALQQAITSGVEFSLEKHKFGTYFKPDSRVRQLLHFEGDTIIEGRMGHSIRFGSSKSDPSTNGLAPNIILRAGQATGAEIGPTTSKSKYGAILEDINKDVSSIWMVSDQTIPFIPSTEQAGSFVRSIVPKAPQKFDKAQIIINSDRVVLNAKKESVMLFSNSQINLNSFSNVTVDTDANIFLTANEQVNLKSNKNISSVTDEDFIINAGSDVLTIAIEKTSTISKKIYLGSSQNDEEPMVGGTSLSKFLARLIYALVNGPIDEPPTSFSSGTNKTAHVIGPQGAAALAPGVIAALSILYSELVPQNPGQENNKSDFAGAPFNSQANFVMLQNEAPEIVKNEFKSGQPTPSIENNKWDLVDQYYRVS